MDDSVSKELALQVSGPGSKYAVYSLTCKSSRDGVPGVQVQGRWQNACIAWMKLWVGFPEGGEAEDREY